MRPDHGLEKGRLAFQQKAQSCETVQTLTEEDPSADAWTVVVFQEQKRLLRKFKWALRGLSC